MNIVLFKRVSSGYEPCQFVKIHQRFRDYLCPHHKGNVLFCCKNCSAVMTVMSSPAAGIGLMQSYHIHLQTKRRNRRLAWVPVLVTVILLAITNEVSTDLPERLSNYCSIVCGKYFCVVLLLWVYEVVSLREKGVPNFDNTDYRNGFFAVLLTSLAVMFIYCIYVNIVQCLKLSQRLKVTKSSKANNRVNSKQWLIQCRIFSNTSRQRISRAPIFKKVKTEKNC